MKKKSIFKVAISTVALMVGLSSCSKCQTCTYGGSSEEICQDDFDDKDAYKAYINFLEAFGTDCN